MTRSTTTISFLEPQCLGFEHAAFNAALMASFHLAYPDARIELWGDPSHLREVHSYLKRSAPGLSYRSVGMPIPIQSMPRFSRKFFEFLTLYRFLTQVKRRRSGILFVLTVKDTTLLLLSILIRLLRIKPRVFTILHSCLADILDKKPRRPWNWMVCLHHVLRIPHPRNLTFIALGDPIYNRISQMRYNRKKNWIPLNLPVFMPKDGRRNGFYRKAGTLRFGFLGITGKGFDVFSRLADDIAPKYSNAQFRLIGFTAGERPLSDYSPYVRGMRETPISRESYLAQLYDLDYCVFTFDDERARRYQLTASATFHDSLACLKPVIGLNNPYIAFYVDRYDDIGYMCHSYGELKRFIESLLDRFPERRYKEQINAISFARSQFDPKFVAGQIRERIGDVGPT